jgi:flagellar hook-associated protein 2
MGIRISGMASGLPPNIVEQIMEAERIPVKQMALKKNKDEDKLKLLSDLSDKVGKIPKAVEELVGIKGFKNTKLTSSDDKVASGFVDPDKSIPGNWQMEILQLAKKAGVKSSGFPDKNKTLAGAGYLKFQTPQGEKDIYISRGQSTLEGIANSINQSQMGLSAQVVESGKSNSEKYQLIITGLNTGKKNHIEFPRVYLLDGEEDFEFTETIQGQNAKIKLDGFEIELAENRAQDIIPGVTLDLKQPNIDRPILLSVKEDFEVIGGKIKEFVDAYNESLSWIQGQAKLQKDKGGKESLGPFGGDSIIRSLEAKLRQIILQPQNDTDGPIKRVSELGIEFNRNGTLNFSQEKFNKILTSTPHDVVKFLRGNLFSTGFIPTVKNSVNSLVNNTTGPLGNKKKGIQDRIKQIDERIERKEAQLVKKEDSLRKKFSDLESKMSKIQTQGASFAAMSGGSGGASAGGPGG